MVQEYVQKKTKELPVYNDSEYQKDDKENTITYLSEIYIGNQKVAQ
jgi:hypothetical protein